MKNIKFSTFVLFWATQSVSQMGSAMSSYALMIWAYNRIHTAMSVSLLTFCYYVPYVAAGFFSGSAVDRHGKKKIMLLADSLAAFCTLTAFFLWQSDGLMLWHIYVISGVIGIMNAFQSPAESVAIGLLVPAEKQAKASGMDSFAENLITVISPVLAVAVYENIGLGTVFLADFSSFLFASLVLLRIWIPENKLKPKHGVTVSPLSGAQNGFRFLRRHETILYIVVTMAVMNFLSRLTYENILFPMLLARSGNNSAVISIVSAALGLGGIAGGLIVTADRSTRNPVKMVYLSAVISFLFGDLLMGFGQNVFVWCAAGLAASVPIPFIMAGQRVLIYRHVPLNMQGRIFSVRNTIQFSTIPAGILLGGLLADNVFEPFMRCDAQVARILQLMVGIGSGSGMAVMFLCTGTLGSLFSVLAYVKIRKNERLKPSLPGKL